MRVAIFSMSLLAIASVHASHAEVVPVEGTFNGAIPTTAMTHPGFTVPELAMPAATQTSLVRGGNAHGMRPLAKNLVTIPATRSTPSQFVLGAPSPRAAGPGNLAAPGQALQARQPPVVRSATDHLLASVVALMLIAYQLRRKHRVLRPHPFTT
jgi:hypothetical protein